MNIRTTPEYLRAQSEFAKLPNKGRRATSRPGLTRKLHFLVDGDTALHFLTHDRRQLDQCAPQLDCLVDAAIAAHPIFDEFDQDSATIWRWFGGRPYIHTTKSYAPARLRIAIEKGVRYDQLPRDLVASPVDGNTIGDSAELRPKDRVGRSGGQAVGPRKGKELIAEDYEKLAAHRAVMDAMGDDVGAAAYARRLGFIPVNYRDNTEGTVHLVTARVPPGLKGYMPFPAGMTIDKAVRAAPGIVPAEFSMPMDPNGRPVIAVNERIDLAQLVWLIGHGYGEGLHRGNVMERLKAAPAKRDFRWRDGNRRDCRQANMEELSRDDRRTARHHREHPQSP